MTKQVKEFDDRDLFIASSTFDPVYLAMAMAPQGQGAIENIMRQWRRSAIFVAQIKAEAAGRVHVLPGMGRPLPAYRLTNNDLANIRFAIRKLGEVLFAAGASEVYLPVAGSGAVRSPAEAAALAEGHIDPRAMDLVSVHALASCRLGHALDSYGKVLNVEGLYVNDASMLPEATGVNPQMTIMAVARRNVAHFLDQRPAMILVTGATGFVGRRFILRQAMAGQAVRCLKRPGKTAPVHHDLLEWREGDITNRSDLASCFEGIGTVVHLAALLSSPDEAANQELNAESTRTLVQLCRIHKVKRFILMSAAAAGFKQTNAYGRSKVRAEKIVSASGLDYAILRVPLLVGKGGSEWERFVDYVQKFPGFVPVFGNGKTIKCPLYIDDAIATLTAIAARNELGNRLWEVACPDRVTLDQMIDLTLAELNQKKHKLHLPLSLSLLLAGMIEKILGGKSPLTKDIVLGINQDVKFDIEAIYTELALCPLNAREAIAAAFRC